MFSGRCRSDIASRFNNRRKGISLLSVIIFTAFAFMVISQVFFYSVNSNESVIEEREIMRVRIILGDMIRQAKSHTSSAASILKGEIKYNEFRKESPNNFYKLSGTPSNVSVEIHNLNYTFDDSGFSHSEWMKLKPYEHIFDQIPGAYLIRAYSPVTKDRSLMIQAVVNSSGNILTWQEVWYTKE